MFDVINRYKQIIEFYDILHEDGPEHCKNNHVNSKELGMARGVGTPRLLQTNGMDIIKHLAGYVLYVTVLLAKSSDALITSFSVRCNDNCIFGSRFFLSNS